MQLLSCSLLVSQRHSRVILDLHEIKQMSEADGKICNKCSQPIQAVSGWQQRMSKTGVQWFHSSCVKCFRCERLITGRFRVTPKGDLLCEDAFGCVPPKK
jgi:hypothetical protein